MSSRKRTPVAKKASGRNIAESERHTERVPLRLTPYEASILRDQAAEQGIPMSGLVGELVRRTWGHLYVAERRAAERKEAP